MKKLYTNPEVEVVKFASVDNTNLLNLSSAGITGTGTVDNLKKVNIGALHQ